MLKEKSRFDNRQMICEFKVWKAICSANPLAQLSEDVLGEFPGWKNLIAFCRKQC